VSTNRGWFLSCLFLLVCALTLSACRNAAQLSPAGPPVPGMSISLIGNGCPSIEISTGDQVTWTNQAQGPRHINVQAPDGAQLFDSGELNFGDSFSFIFSEAGTYSYTCSADQETRSAITVAP
jgi:hypothetical protein